MTGYKYAKQHQEYQILSVSMVVTALPKKKRKKKLLPVTTEKLSLLGMGQLAAKQQFTNGTEKDTNLGRFPGYKQALLMKIQVGYLLVLRNKCQMFAIEGDGFGCIIAFKEAWFSIH